jgi:catechol 2,3-dioxygenase-like lactoylglutathione lyase family enzyme
MTYALKHLYHSTHLVPDLDEAAAFFSRVFGRKSTLVGEYLGTGQRPAEPGGIGDFSNFTPIGEVQFECVNPNILVVEGTQLLESVAEPHLGGLAWFVDGIEDLWAELRRRGLSGTGMRESPPDWDGPPQDPSGAPIIFTLPEEVGLSYEFLGYKSRLDPRGDPPVPAVFADDPLGIECCSHHTVATNEPERARRLLVDIVGGRVIHEGTNESLDTASTYIALADAIVELARPLDAASAVAEDLRRRAPDDSYHSLTWKVRDLDRVADHLEALGVRLSTRGPTSIVTDATNALGIPWGFSSVLCPGDPRE